MPENSVSWIWWGFTTIVLALLVNLVSSYTKPYVDAWLNKFSDGRRIRSQKKQEKYIRQLEAILANPNRFVGLQANIVINIILGTWLILLGSIICTYILFRSESHGSPDNTSLLIIFITFITSLSGVTALDRTMQLLFLTRDYLAITDPENEEE